MYARIVDDTLRSVRISEILADAAEGADGEIPQHRCDSKGFLRRTDGNGRDEFQGGRKCFGILSAITCYLKIFMVYFELRFISPEGR